MSLQQQKKLAELKSESIKYSEQRERSLLEKKSIMLEEIKDQTINFLKSEDFEVKDLPHQQTISADYKGLVITVKYSKVDDWFFGAHSMFEIHYEKKQYNVAASLKTESLPSFQGIFSSPQEKLEKEIAYYEELVPKQKQLGTSDITGEYTLKLTTHSQDNRQVPQNKDTKIISSITDALSEIFNV
ncbi:conserved hypothetical protein [Vibrio crassostreae]|nr:conserved hypothetical protein [Vibrio crassostreae]CAK2319846.1 conserved hypothetical protein [Vibrio crassostreae]